MKAKLLQRRAILEELPLQPKMASWRKLPTLGQLTAFDDDYSEEEHSNHQEAVWWELHENGNLQSEYQRVVDYIRRLPTPLVLYRAIHAPNLDEVKNGVRDQEVWKKLDQWSQIFYRDGFGVCWTPEESLADSYNAVERNKDVWVFRGTVDETDVNWEQTIFLMMVSSQEYEVRLEDGASVQITGCRKREDTGWQKPPNRLKEVLA